MADNTTLPGTGTQYELRCTVDTNETVVAKDNLLVKRL